MKSNAEETETQNYVAQHVTLSDYQQHVLVINKIKNRSDLLTFLQNKFENRFKYDKAVFIFNETEAPEDYRFLETDTGETCVKRSPIDFNLFDTISTACETEIIDLSSSALPKQLSVFYREGFKNLLAFKMSGNIGALLLFYTESNIPSVQESTSIQMLIPHLSSAVENVFLRETLQKKDRDASILLALSNSIATIRNKLDLFDVIDQQLKKLFHFEDFVICLINDDNLSHSPFIYNHREDFLKQEGIAPAESKKYTLDDGMCRAMISTAEPVVFNVEEVLKWPDAPAWLGFWHNMGIREMIALKLTDRDECIGFFYLYAKKTNAVSNIYYGLLKNISLQISVAVSNIKANEKIERQLNEIQLYKQQLEEEKTYLREEIELKFQHSEMIGQSEVLKRVFYLSEQVATSDSSVLILGETGTGKELIARNIHKMSPRADFLLVKVNCAALPTQLAESELFGHEKGSFTGATERRIGKFELAHKGTLFLDEIGELSPDLQVKLLRALQEKEIERVGGNQVIKTDVRIIAATNRNLLKEVEKGNFRSDLYYRLNAFPIPVPPLRARREDIPQLTAYFISKTAKKTGKPLSSISKSALNKLQAYSWPGNIRELEHFIERTILLNKGELIKEIHLPKTENPENFDDGNSRIKSIYENERAHILSVLKSCNGKISGVGGAAKVLNIPPTTLNSKIKKFNIKRAHIQK
ncbi:sigma 54-interacting transcriptional regulator [Pedobacter sp. AW1-32]|uniref:sigma-54-dependent Fis family transcriptional regulator n=1 Tax=Pedobacter sp. AW1-32 TaxID=3383026 RepID=UPI003FEF6DAE